MILEDRITSSAPIVGLLHPGEMGASVGAAARAAGAKVLWCSEGRSAASRGRAGAAGLVECPSLARLCEESEVVLSVCPPSHADALAAAVAATGFAGAFVDANAVAPATVRALAAHFDPDHVQFVDGGLIGPPAWRAGSTRLHLSGEGADAAAALFAGSPLAARVVEGGIAAASAFRRASTKPRPTCMGGSPSSRTPRRPNSPRFWSGCEIPRLDASSASAHSARREMPMRDDAASAARTAVQHCTHRARGRSR